MWCCGLRSFELMLSLRRNFLFLHSLHLRLQVCEVERECKVRLLTGAITFLLMVLVKRKFPDRCFCSSIRRWNQRETCVTLVCVPFWAQVRVILISLIYYYIGLGNMAQKRITIILFISVDIDNYHDKCQIFISFKFKARCLLQSESCRNQTINFP